MDPARLWLVSYCTVKYRPGLSSERTPSWRSKQLSDKREYKIWLWALKGSWHQGILTDWSSVAKSTSTSNSQGVSRNRSEVLSPSPSFAEERPVSTIPHIPHMSVFHICKAHCVTAVISLFWLCYSIRYLTVPPDHWEDICPPICPSDFMSKCRLVILVFKF
jgi:hypothetical protein